MRRSRPISDRGGVALLSGFCLGTALLALAGLADGEPRPPEACEDAFGLLGELCRVPVHKSDLDENPEHRGGRLVGTEVAIRKATDDLTEQAWLAQTAINESGLARYVDLDAPRCADGHGGRCDGGRAWSMWQLHGTDRTGGRDRAAEIAIQAFRRGARYCSARGFDYWVGGTALFATGKVCEWDGAEKRVAQMWDIRGRL